MSKNNQKNSLDTEQRDILKQVHAAQITLEVSFAVLIFALFTINVASVLPGYGVVAFFIMLAAGLTMFVSGIILTAAVSAMRRQAKPLLNRSVPARRWTLVTWGWGAVLLLLFIFNSPFQGEEFDVGRFILLCLAICGLAVSILGSIVSVHVLWRRFNKKRRPPIRPIAYAVVGANMLLLAILGSYTTTEVLSFNSVATTDSNLELGQSEVRQVGKNGEKQIRHNLIFGFAMSTDTSDPVDEIVANGSRRYQYMHCSNGRYVYYTAEQFKDPRVGFTHQSSDACAEKGYGKQITIADVPPAEKVIQRVPTYYPSYTPNSYTTTCNAYSFSNSITCRTY